MEILLRVILIFLLVLIKIGDFVIFVFNAPHNFLKKITKFFAKHIFAIRIKLNKYNPFAGKKRKQHKPIKEYSLYSRQKYHNAGRWIKIILFLAPLFILKKLFFILKLLKKTQRSIVLGLFLLTIKIINNFICAIKISIYYFFRILLFPLNYLIKGKRALKENIFPEKKSIQRHHKKKFSVFPVTFLIKMKYYALGATTSLIFIFIPFLILIFIQDIPNPKELTLRQIPQTTKIYDRNGMLLYQIYASQNRTVISLSEIPKNLINATIAIEDKDFYNHPGFDISAIIRSAYKDVSGEGFQGGSTITQQLIKSALLTPETSMIRKVKEVIIAFWAERIYSKDQILEMYFNQVPYGGTAWGVEAASDVYFGKSTKDLDLAESAFLAGIPKAPTVYSPYGQYPDLWKKRQKEVLNRMVFLRYITQSQEDSALKEELAFKSPRIPIKAPHFVMYIKDQLIQKYGLPAVEKGGLNVVTSLDLGIQEKAQNIVAAEVENDRYLNLTNGAAVITNPANGDILAMVGSRDFSYPGFGNVNVATSFRQPGSSIKVVTYSAALSKNLTAATIIDDSPVAFPDGTRAYIPVNYDGKFHGRIPIRLALANSFNIPAVKVLNQIGVPEMVSLGKNMGIKSWGDSSRYGLSITLGGAETTMLDMATVYGVLANKGIKVDLNPFIKITDIKGNVLEEKKQNGWNQILAEGGKNKTVSFDTGKRALDEGVAYIISNILSDNSARSLEFGTNSPLNIPGKTVSVKTGTSDNKRDNWTIGYTPSFVVTVWVGNNDGSPMSQTLASGITGAAPIWNKIMNELLANSRDYKPELPVNVVSKTCLGKTEYFIRGTENSVNCTYIPTVTPSPAAN
ncbi:MAG: PBP1A family penicillin-binding protein [Patescibacteria group bacterium]|nr:PBP1A family penicillin-binding protein [Patescibacteria group bacterium]